MAGQALPRVPGLRRQGRGGPRGGEGHRHLDARPARGGGAGRRGDAGAQRAARPPRPALRAAGRQPAHRRRLRLPRTARRSSCACAGPRDGSSSRPRRRTNVAGKAGGLSLDVESKPAERTLVYKRRFDVTQRRLDTSAGVRGRPFPVRRRGEKRCAESRPGPRVDAGGWPSPSSPSPPAAAVLAAGHPLAAATVLEKTIDVEIRPDGVTERTHLRVRLDNPPDFCRLVPLPHRARREPRDGGPLGASATRPDGKVLTSPAATSTPARWRARGTSTPRSPCAPSPSRPCRSARCWPSTTRCASAPTSPPASSLSARRRGDRVAAGHRRTARGAGWRYRLDGAMPGLNVQEVPGGVTVTGAKLAGLTPPEKAPDLAGDGALLRYAWGDAASWEAIGRWYPASSPGAAQRRGGARQGARADRRRRRPRRDDRRRRIAALADFARRQVRYVAVEVGIGGYRPHEPQQVIERLWGDCKDKALLLVDLLHEAGIEAYPALARLDPEGRVDRDFPSPFQFNHMIVAVPAAGLGLAAGRAGGRRLPLPRRHAGDRRPRLAAAGGAGPGGAGGARRRQGRAGAHAGAPRPGGAAARRGARPGGRPARRAAPPGWSSPARAGAAFLHLHGGAKPQEVDRVLRRVFATLLPAGAELSDLRWQSVEGGLPDVRLDGQGRPSPPWAPAAERARSRGSRSPRWSTSPLRGCSTAAPCRWSRTPSPAASPGGHPPPRRLQGRDAGRAVRERLGAFHQTVAIHGRELALERDRRAAPALDGPRRLPGAQGDRPRRGADQQAAAAGELRPASPKLSLPDRDPEFSGRGPGRRTAVG